MPEEAGGADEAEALTVEQKFEILKLDPRVREAIQLAATGQPASIGLMVYATSAPYDDAGGPRVPGFEPTLVTVAEDRTRAVRVVERAGIAKISMQGLDTGDLSYTMAVSIDLGPAGLELLKQLLAYATVSIAPRFKPCLWRSVPYIGADPVSQRKQGLATAYDGRDVAVCVVDMGCDFAHRNFRTADGSASRIKFLWVQNKDTDPAEYSNAMLNSWLGQNDAAKIYQVYDPHNPDFSCIPPGSDGAHGTVVLDTAAGSGGGTGVAGVAPGANLYFVQVYVNKETTSRYIDGIHIYLAVQTFLKEIDKSPTFIPAVVNISLGSNEGPHDSDTIVTKGDGDWWRSMDALFKNKDGRALVVAAGNQRRTALHVSGRLMIGVPASFDVFVPRGDSRRNSFKFWLNLFNPSDARLKTRAALVDFKGAPKNYTPVWIDGVPPGDIKPTIPDDAQRLGARFERPNSYSSAGDLCSLSGWIDPPLARMPPQVTDNDRWEIWRFELTSMVSTSVPFRVHGWMERDDGDQACFVDPKLPGGTANSTVDPDFTLNTAAAGIESAITVGAVGAATYFPGSPVDGPGLGQPTAFTSAGPTRKGRLRPDICAPGEFISGALSRADPVVLHTGYGKAPISAMSGTSFAPPHVAGLIALYFQKHAGNLPTPEGLRAALIDAARPETPYAARRWDPQLGYGCIDAIRLLK